MISIFLDGEPPHTTHQQRGVKVLRKPDGSHVPMFFTKAKVQEAEQWYVSRLTPYAPPRGQPFFPGVDPLRLELTFVFNWSKTNRKLREKGKLAECVWRINRPDVDNSAKLLVDCLTNMGFWLDDAMVAEMNLRKVNGDRPGVFVSVEPLKPSACCPPPWYRVPDLPVSDHVVALHGP